MRTIARSAGLPTAAPIAPAPRPHRVIFQNGSAPFASRSPGIADLRRSYAPNLVPMNDAWRMSDAERPLYSPFAPSCFTTRNPVRIIPGGGLIAEEDDTEDATEALVPATPSPTHCP
eukprot:31346-Pelagococcus_subviridis.AAC.27